MQMEKLTSASTIMFKYCVCLSLYRMYIYIYSYGSVCLKPRAYDRYKAMRCFAIFISSGLNSCTHTQMYMYVVAV